MSSLLVVAGNLIVDDVVYEDGKTDLGRAGGAALYVALGAAVWGVAVGIASVVGDDYPRHILDALDEKGVDLGGVRKTHGPGMRTWLLYEGRRRQVVHHLDSPSHARMSPTLDDLPRSWRPSAYHLAPMPLETQGTWLKELNELAGPAGGGDPMISLDPYALVNEESLDSLRTLFDQADLVLLSEDELLLEEALDRPEDCLKRLAAAPRDTSRMRRVCLKRGARGGIVYDRIDRAFQEWQPRVSDTIDTTGAGDAFAGGLLAGLLGGRPIETALEQAVVSASFALDARGAEGLLRTTPAEGDARYREWFGEPVS